MAEKEIVELIAKNLVDNPDKVSVKVVEGENSTIMELRVDKADVGKVIGGKGILVKSLRSIVNAVAVKNGRKVTLEILD